MDPLLSFVHYLDPLLTVGPIRWSSSVSLDYAHFFKGVNLISGASLTVMFL